ncbi:MAG: 23S rRNA (uracil(1939)-C(5))-methyltransferase RlmD [Oscillospiraceae bacterium]|jgi:23S rRNA (uracil1939-C5)-methyltransferase|nr:23S rRNA (uracil(1939)-C(5))-methyltransferase RlmD [Oscillospiraceae bacterium]
MEGILKKNMRCRAVIEGYTSEGFGVARLDGRAVFVHGGARGDECLLRILKAGPDGPVYAAIETLLVASPARCVPVCPVYRPCGGCHFQHIDYEEELALKKTRVEDALVRIGKLDLPVETIWPAPALEGYRNKALFPVRAVDGRPSTGFFRARSHDLVPVAHCALQSEEANALAAALRSWMEGCDVTPYDEASGTGLIRHLFVRTGVDETLACLVASGAAIPCRQALVRRLRAACPSLVGLVLQANARRDNVVLSGKTSLLWGRETMEDTLCGLRFRLSAASFYQVNRQQAERLYTLTAEYAALAAGDTLLDLYCGAGTLTLHLARGGVRGYGVELSAEAVRRARENAAHNGLPQVKFLQGDAAEAAARLRADGARPDVVTVDPPRKGLAAALIETIVQMAPARVVYLSCDPATLARDLARFASLGYAPVRCAAVDMFPRTAHVESVCLLERGGVGLANQASVTSGSEG